MTRWLFIGETQDQFKSRRLAYTTRTISGDAKRVLIYLSIGCSDSIPCTICGNLATMPSCGIPLSRNLIPEASRSRTRRIFVRFGRFAA